MLIKEAKYNSNKVGYILFFKKYDKKEKKIRK